jgi:hypothetical protein
MVCGLVQVVPVVPAWQFSPKTHGKTLLSMDWLGENLQESHGKPHISWENRWFPVPILPIDTWI